MAIRKDRKLYMAALGLAVAGLALDRIVLDGGALGPGTASAAPSDITGAGELVLPPAAPVEPDAVAQLAERLLTLEQERALDLTRVRNAFWLEGVSASGTPATHLDDVEQRIKAFRDAHQLRAVMNSPQGSFVIVGKERVEVGGHLAVFTENRTDLFTLVEILVDHKAGRRAVFNFNGRTVVLEMDAPNSAETGGTAQDRGDANR
jgi:hypothetical protein